MSAEIVFLERQSSLIARIPGEVDHHNANRLRESIDARLFYVRPRQLVLDFASVEFMDSSGLALILGRAEVAAAIGATVRLTGLSERHERLVRLAGLERIKNLTISAKDE